MKNKKKLYLCLGLSLTILTALGVTYGYMRRTNSQVTSNQITTLECMNTTLTDVTNAISIHNDFPINPDEGMNRTPYTFTIINNCDSYYEIQVGLESLQSSTLLPNYLVASLNVDGESTNRGSILSAFTTGTPYNGGTNYILKTEGLFPNETKTYDLRLWIEQNTTLEQGQNKSFNGKIVITQTAKLDPRLDKSGANEPLLADNMIPVYYDEINDVWKKADNSNMDSSNPWYNYDKQIWANAVTVTSATRTTYNTASSGTSIPMDDIVGMWVWIPRFEYRTDNLGLQYAGGTLALPGELGVNFISNTDTTNTANYLIHPAFRNGTVYKRFTDYDLGGWDKELTGFWYGKFETGYASNLTTATGTISSGILIKPDVYGMDFQNISNEFATSLNIQNDHGIGNQIETHMSKNDEWGAVVYLSQSKYGKFGNIDYSGANKEVYVNNAYYSSGTINITGRSNGTYGGGIGSGASQYGTYEYNNCAASSNTKTPCGLSTRQTNATKGTGASTTGNIYGIYDMSGGLFEYVMGVLQYNANYIYAGYGDTACSGFTGYKDTKLYNGVTLPAQKFFNRYTTETITTSCNGISCKGHALGFEVGNGLNNGNNNWYNDYMSLPSSITSWVERGNNADSSEYGATGIFNSTCYHGGPSGNYGFRVVAG